MNVCIFCGSSVPHIDKIAEEARQLGRLLARRGDVLLYGGSNLGLMGEVSGGALAEGGEVTAVIPTFFSEAIINSQQVSNLVRVATLAERKEYLIAHSDAFVALWGGIGTLDEILEVLVAKQLGQARNAAGCTQHKGKPVILYNRDGFFDPFLQQLDRMEAEGFFRSGKRPELTTARTIDEIIAQLDG